MIFADKLKGLRERATSGPIVVVDCRPDRDLLTLTDGVSVLCRIENRVTQMPLDSEDEANAELIVFLANHAEQIEALVRASQAVYDRWQTPTWKEAAPTADAINVMRDALAALDKEQK